MTWLPSAKLALRPLHRSRDAPFPIGRRRTVEEFQHGKPKKDVPLADILLPKGTEQAFLGTIEQTFIVDEKLVLIVRNKTNKQLYKAVMPLEPI